LIFDFHGLSSSQVGVGPYKLRVCPNLLIRQFVPLPRKESSSQQETLDSD